MLTWVDTMLGTVRVSSNYLVTSNLNPSTERASKSLEHTPTRLGSGTAGAPRAARAGRAPDLPPSGCALAW